MYQVGPKIFYLRIRHFGDSVFIILFDTEGLDSFKPRLFKINFVENARKNIKIFLTEAVLFRFKWS